MTDSDPDTSQNVTDAPPPRLSTQLQGWLDSDSEKTLGGLIDTFGRNSFALLLVLLLAVAALPLPTGGVTHIFEIIAALLAVQLIVGVRRIWLPQRWRKLEVAGQRQRALVAKLAKLINWLEQRSKPRLSWLFGRRLSEVVYGLVALVGIVGAFLAPPFSGLDTLPALGVVVLSISMMLTDALIATAGALLIVAGVVLEFALGSAAVHGISSLF